MPGWRTPSASHDTPVNITPNNSLCFLSNGPLRSLWSVSAYSARTYWALGFATGILASMGAKCNQTTPRGQRLCANHVVWKLPVDKLDFFADNAA